MVDFSLAAQCLAAAEAAGRRWIPVDLIELPLAWWLPGFLVSLPSVPRRVLHVLGMVVLLVRSCRAGTDLLHVTPSFVAWS